MLPELVAIFPLLRRSISIDQVLCSKRRTLRSTKRSLDSKLLDCTDYDPRQTILFGNTSQTSSNNFKIINASIDYILSSKRFDEPLFKINSFISKSEFD